MKKLNHLKINSEKIMKNEELINLRGGTNPWDCGAEGQYWLCSIYWEWGETTDFGGCYASSMGNPCNWLENNYPYVQTCHYCIPQGGN